MANSARREAVAELISRIETEVTALKAVYDGPRPMTDIPPDKYPCLLVIDGKEREPDRSVTATILIAMEIELWLMYGHDQEGAARDIEDALITVLEGACADNLNDKADLVDTLPSTGALLWKAGPNKVRIRAVLIEYHIDR